MNVQLLPGAEGIKQVYERVLSESKADFICPSQGYTQVLSGWYDENFSPRLFGSNVTTRELLLDAPDNREYAKRKDAKKNAVRFITEASESDMIVTPGFAALVSYNPEASGAILIEDPELVTALRHVFELGWSGARV